MWRDSIAQTGLVSVTQNGKRLRGLNEQPAAASEEVERLGGLTNHLSTRSIAPVLKFISFHMYALKLVALFAVWVAAVGLPSYLTGARWYHDECGDWFVHATAAYLFDAPELELLLAVLVVSCVLLASVSVVKLMFHYCNPPLHHEQGSSTWHRCKLYMRAAMLWSIWFLMIARPTDNANCILCCFSLVSKKQHHFQHQF